MARYYRTREGDMLDAICKAEYGREIGPTEAVLAANPQLAEHGPCLPAGLQIWLPDLPPAATASVRLWD